jgi:hypothetical protein
MKFTVESGGEAFSSIDSPSASRSALREQSLGLVHIFWASKVRDRRRPSRGMKIIKGGG